MAGRTSVFRSTAHDAVPARTFRRRERWRPRVNEPRIGAVIALIRSAMCDLMPRAAGLPGVADTDVDAFLRALRREAHPLYWLGLVVGAIVYALTPVLTVYLPLPSFALPARLRARHAQRIVELRPYLLRQAISLVRLSAGMCWGQHPEVRARFALAAYPPDPGTFRT
jgi:hypothetical protein